MVGAKFGSNPLTVAYFFPAKTEFIADFFLVAGLQNFHNLNKIYHGVFRLLLRLMYSEL